MHRRTLRAVSAAAVLALLIPAVAQAQTGLGVRAGSFSVSGDHVEMDASTAFGAHLALGFIPVLKFQLGIEYLKGDATYDYDGYAAVENEFQSIGVYADVRYPIEVLPLVPVKPVVGGGLDLNVMSYWDEETVAGLDPGADLADFQHVGYHLIVGLLFDPPVLPFTITAEYRMQWISLEDDEVTNNGILLGLTFGF